MERLVFDLIGCLRKWTTARFRLWQISCFFPLDLVKVFGCFFGTSFYRDYDSIFVFELAESRGELDLSVLIPSSCGLLD